MRVESPSRPVGRGDQFAGEAQLFLAGLFGQHAEDVIDDACDLQWLLLEGEFSRFDLR